MSKRIEFTQEQLDKMKELYESGLGSRRIAKVFDVSRQTIDRRLRKMDTKIRPIGVGGGIPPASVNEHFFDDLGHERPAYYLGLLFADGCVYDRPHGRQKVLSLSQSMNGAELVEQFVHDIEYGGNINHYIHKDGRTGVIVQITSDYLCDRLIALGCTQKKTLVIRFPSQVPWETMRHFLRGYTDGDGCLGIYDGQSKIRISSGSRPFLVEFRGALCAMLPTINDNNKISKVRRKNCYTLQWSSNFQCAQIASLLYGDCSVALLKKYDMAQQMMAI